MFCHGDTSIVTRLDDDTFIQVIHADLFTHFDKHLRGVIVVFSPGILTDGNHISWFDTTGFQFLTNDIRGHHFGQTGWWQALFGVFTDQDLATVVVHQQMRFCGNLWWAW